MAQTPQHPEAPQRPCEGLIYLDCNIDMIGIIGWIEHFYGVEIDREAIRQLTSDTGYRYRIKLFSLPNGIHDFTKRMGNFSSVLPERYTQFDVPVRYYVHYLQGGVPKLQVAIPRSYYRGSVIQNISNSICASLSSSGVKNEDEMAYGFSDYLFSFNIKEGYGQPNWDQVQRQLNETFSPVEVRGIFLYERSILASLDFMPRS